MFAKKKNEKTVNCNKKRIFRLLLYFYLLAKCNAKFSPAVTLK